MSNTSVLYVRGTKATSSNEDLEKDEGDVWEDRTLNDAFDKALNMANLEVAKRVAMSTNTTHHRKESFEGTSEPQMNQQRTTKNQKKSKQAAKREKKAQKKESKQIVWNEGMACRARYDADGFEYEAIVLTILDEETCVIKYIGYNNTEVVPISSLQSSLGKEARRHQMMEAMADEEEECSVHSSIAGNVMPTGGLDADGMPPVSNHRAGRNKRAVLDRCFQMPPMPDLSMLREFGDVEMPMAPPPVLGMLGGQSDADDQALSNMLVSWYMSGYYTGLYQGMKRSKRRQRNY